MSSPPPSTNPPPMVWPPMPPTVMPFPLPWGGTGCCPPGGMSALMQCYCDIQQASAFIAQIMIDQINNNPDVVAAIIAAIEKSGSNLPLIGVTNGSDAQPGQVGEFVHLTATVPYAAYPATTSTTVSIGVLQPGDWDLSLTAMVFTPVTSLSAGLNPAPPGTSNDLYTATSFGVPGAGGEQIATKVATCRASFSVPTLLPIQVGVYTSGDSSIVAGNVAIDLGCRRAR